MQSMTRQPKKPAKLKLPKPVEAWAVFTVKGKIAAICEARRIADRYLMADCVLCRVRIVPVQPKKRRVRKEK